MAGNFSSIPLSILELALINEGHTPADAFRTSLALAQQAESSGYNRFWVAEHHNMESVGSSATVVLMGYLAGGTSTIRIGSGGIMLPNHAPLIVAEQVGTLASLYPDRIDLGLGRAPGTDQLTAMALRRDHDAAMNFHENIREIQTYFSVENRHSAVRAIPGEGLDIPLWILGSSTDSAHLAAALGLPYAFASHFAPAHLLDAMSIYRENFRPSVQLDKPYFMPCVNVIAADTEEEARLIATSFKQLILGLITGQRKRLQKPDEKLFLSDMEETAIQQMATYSFIGHPEKIREGLRAFVKKTQADELIIASQIFDHNARVHSYEIVRQVLQ